MRVLITAGPTREYLDSVRYLSNASSGRLGYALARSAARRGHAVTLVSGPVDLPAPRGVRMVRVVSAAEMAAACRRAFKRVDAAIMAAAVCDYRPVRRQSRKLPKRTSQWNLALEPTEDIAAALGRMKGRRVLIGFALEDRQARPHAEAKLRRKRCDAIVLNGPGNIGADQATIEIFQPAEGWSGPYRGGKAVIAGRIIRLLESLAALDT